MRHLLLLMLWCQTGAVLGIKSYIEIPENVNISSTNYTISPFSPKTFVKSAEFMLNATQCIQYNFRLLERRVRLHAYTCLLSEGGFCTLDKFSFPEDREGCTYLRPWTHKIESWSFYFVLEKRARKFGKAWHRRNNSSRSHRKMKRESEKNKSMSIEANGILELFGVVDCSEACGNQEGLKLGSQSDGTFHRGRGNRLLY